ncbi:MAG: ethylbenzene dehydrogenase-related protein, partial [Spirochaetota bacterium]
MIKDNLIIKMLLFVSILVFGLLTFSCKKKTAEAKPAIETEEKVEVVSIPADIYFSLAITDNSHNHSGDNLLFLDFQEKADPGKVDEKVIISPKVANGSITLDGDISEWKKENLSTVKGRVMNNYPLSEFYDAIPTDITVGSAFDDTFIYFAVQWEDANHDMSINRNRWVYDGKKWNKMKHVAVNPDSPNRAVVNRNDPLSGSESEDRLFVMFPIRDSEKNFSKGSYGCAMYCHGYLKESGDPKEKRVGDGVVAMHTNRKDDIADIWHWTSTRSNPGDTLTDEYLVFKGEDDEDKNGRKADEGKGNYSDNKNDQGQPAFMGRSEPGVQFLFEDDKTEIAGGFKKGDTLSYTIYREPEGSRVDVTVKAKYDPSTFKWTLELKRLLDTGNEDDHQFIPGVDAQFPALTKGIAGNADKGKALYVSKKCAQCHGDTGAGTFKD